MSAVRMPVNPGVPAPKREQASPLTFALGAGTELVVSVLLGFFAGRWLDGRFNTAPWIMLAGSIAGIAVGLFQLIRTAQERQAGRR